MTPTQTPNPNSNPNPSPSPNPNPYPEPRPSPEPDQVLYISSFALGVGPIPAIMTGELLPAAVRANGAATAFGVHWLCNIVIGNYFLLASQRFGVPACYTLFGGVALAGAAFCASQVPETKGRSLEEIEAEYAPA